MKQATLSRIHYTKPSITALETEYAADAAAHGWGVHCYDYIERFETGFAKHLGVTHAIATSSGTGALHLGMAALGIGPGDEVIVGDINWIASAAPIVHLGASPVMVDVLADTWCLDPTSVENAITPRTKAILAVHLYGNLCDMDRLLEIGARYGIPIIEDAAEAVGSRWSGARAGSLGVFGAFSFHGTKTITTGEGGMFVTSDTRLHARALTLSNHGRVRGDIRQFFPMEVGFKYKMSNVQAAIGCAQLERIETLIQSKRRIFSYYSMALNQLPVHMNPEPAGTENGYWMPTIVAHSEARFDREALLARFNEQNIDGRVFFWPLSSLPMFVPVPTNVVAASLSTRAVNLPSYHDLKEIEMDRVVACVTEAFGPHQ